MRLIVLAVGRLRPPYTDDVQHYHRLLARHARLELIEVRDDEAVARRVPERCHVVALDAQGTSYDSVGFSRYLDERRRAATDLVFVIGGAFGLPDDLPHVDHRLSLGPMTLPHQLARVVLLEQLYRGHKILANEPYHH